MTNYKRGLPPNVSMGIGNSIKLRLVEVLEQIYNDYKNDKVIDHLSMKYGKSLSPAYLRKIIGSEIIVRMTKSKKNMHYKWNAGDNPDFYDLADKVLAYSSRTPAKKHKNESSIYNTRLTILLLNNGIEEGKTLLLVPEIMKIFFPE